MIHTQISGLFIDEQKGNQQENGKQANQAAYM